MKKKQKSIDQLKKKSISVLEKHQQAKLKGGVKKNKIRIPGSSN